MNVDKVYNKISLRNLKRAKLNQRKAELKIAQKHNKNTEHLEQDIKTLEKEIDRLF